MIEGLSIRSPLTEIKPEFDLKGLGIEIKQGPIQIAGAFLRVGDEYFLGTAMVQVAKFGLAAIGGYAKPAHSFFIFVRLTAPLGGPPFFFVTGLAAGFGINRAIDIPPIDDILTFGLLPQNQSKPETQLPTALDPGKAGSNLIEVLEKTGSYIHPKPGEYWMAAGIDFTSFNVVQASALLTVAFGVKFGRGHHGYRGDQHPLLGQGTDRLPEDHIAGPLLTKRQPDCL